VNPHTQYLGTHSGSLDTPNSAPKPAPDLSHLKILEIFLEIFLEVINRNAVPNMDMSGVAVRRQVAIISSRLSSVHSRSRGAEKCQFRTEK